MPNIHRRHHKRGRQDPFEAHGQDPCAVYRIVVADSRTKRDGRVIEEIGKYHPKEEPSLIEVVSDRAQYWLGVGAQPTDAVDALLKVTGDWQRFKGEPAPRAPAARQGGWASRWTSSTLCISWLPYVLLLGRLVAQARLAGGDERIGL